VNFDADVRQPDFADVLDFADVVTEAPKFLFRRKIPEYF
jgi:hypothetical protein